MKVEVNKENVRVITVTWLPYLFYFQESPALYKYKFVGSFPKASLKVLFSLLQVITRNSPSFISLMFANQGRLRSLLKSNLFCLLRDCSALISILIYLNRKL